MIRVDFHCKASFSPRRSGLGRQAPLSLRCGKRRRSNSRRALEARFHGSLGQAHGARRGGHIHLMKVVEDHRLAIPHGQGQHGPPHRFVALLPGQTVVLCGSAGRLGNLFDRNVYCGKSLQLGAKHVRREREQPRGKARLAPPPRQSAPGAQKRLLGHLFGAPSVAAIAPGHVHQRSLPAADDALEGLHLAAQYAAHIGQVFFGAHRRVHLESRSSATSQTVPHPSRLHFL